jgi:predicted PurR-regulated permease PerM
LTLPPGISRSSPKWGSTIKLIVGLTLTGIVFLMIIYFRSIIGPLLLAIILTYLLHPLAARLTKATKLSWRASVNILFLTLLILLAGLSTAMGVIVVQQVQSLIKIIQTFLTDLPSTLDSLSNQQWTLGPFQFDLSQYLDLNTLSDKLIQAIQLLIGRVGFLVSTFATGAASTVGWGFFVLLISYFTLADAGQVPDVLKYFQIPGYDYDIRRLSRELGRIWNAFLRGQILIVVLVIISYSILLSALGVRYALGIALLAGLARFVPYIGPWSTTLVTFLVAFFQGFNYYHMAPVFFALLAIGLSFLLDQIFDNLVSPRIMGTTLGINPAAVLIVAILAANFIGIIGLVLAAPVLASFRLIGQYIIRKLFDLDPWIEPEEQPKPLEPPFIKRILRQTQAWWRFRKNK